MNFPWSKKKAAEDGPTKGQKNYARSFEAAAYSRLNSSWSSVDFSPSQELFNDLRVLKVRSRDLYCNSPVINNFVSLLQQNVVGANGFTFRSLVGNARGGINTGTAQKIEDAWADFCKRGNFEITGQYGIVDALDLAVQSLAVDGEILWKKFYGEGKFNLTMQLLHSEQLIIDRYEHFDMGIKRDQYGKPLEYCLTNHHPGEGLIRYVYEPASTIIHAYIPYQVGAPRGIPMASAVMGTVKMLDEYRKAELVAARISASKFVAYTQTQPDDLDSELAMESVLPASSKKPTLEPGMELVLPPGVDMKYLSAEHPSVAFDPFTSALKREIACGLGLSYNNLYSDFQNTSFSSMKAAFIVERAFYRKIQALVIEKVLTPIFEAWIDAACASGALGLQPVLGSYDFYKSCEFRGITPEFADAVKEAEALKMLIEERLLSRTQAAASRGMAYADILADIKAEQDLEKSLGIVFSTTTKGTIVVAPAGEDLNSNPSPAF